MALVNTTDLNGKKTLPNGDKIRLETSDSKVGGDQIEIALQLEGVSWWKGIQLEHLILCQCQDNQPYNSSHVSFAQFNTLNLNLWKAGLFGVHTPVYTIADAHTAMQPGKCHTFIWLLDNA